MLNFFNMTSDQVAMAAERYYDRMLERYLGPESPYDRASEAEIEDFVREWFEEELAEDQEESPYMTEQEIVEQFIRFHEDDVIEKYNEKYIEDHTTEEDW